MLGTTFVAGSIFACMTHAGVRRAQKLFLHVTFFLCEMLRLLAHFYFFFHRRITTGRVLQEKLYRIRRMGDALPSRCCNVSDPTTAMAVTSSVKKFISSLAQRSAVNFYFATRINSPKFSKVGEWLSQTSRLSLSTLWCMSSRAIHDSSQGFQRIRRSSRLCLCVFLHLHGRPRGVGTKLCGKDSV